MKSHLSFLQLLRLFKRSLFVISTSFFILTILVIYQEFGNQEKWDTLHFFRQFWKLKLTICEYFYHQRKIKYYFFRNFSKIFIFLTKISIFDENFDSWPEFKCLSKLSSFDQIYILSEFYFKRLYTNFQFLMKIWTLQIVDKNFDFGKNYDLLFSFEHNYDVKFY